MKTTEKGLKKKGAEDGWGAEPRPGYNRGGQNTAWEKLREEGDWGGGGEDGVR